MVDVVYSGPDLETIVAVLGQGRIDTHTCASATRTHTCPGIVLCARSIEFDLCWRRLGLFVSAFVICGNDAHFVVYGK